VHEAGEDHPARPAIFAKLLGRLEEVLKLRHVCVRITVVHESVQIFRSLPNAHLHPVQAEELFPLGLNESYV